MKMKLPSGFVFIAKYKPKNAVEIDCELEERDLIFCRNCTHSGKNKNGDFYCTWWGDRITDPDGWCYLAERRVIDVRKI